MRKVNNHRLGTRGGMLIFAAVVGMSLLPAVVEASAINYVFRHDSQYSAAVSQQGAYSDPGNNTWNFISETSGAATSSNKYSDGTISPVTLMVTYEGYTGAGGYTAGTDLYLQSWAAYVNGNRSGTITLASVPQGTYDLYLYGSNYDRDRGTAFTFGGASDFTANSNTANTFTLGVNYVILHNVTPVSGTISGTYTAALNHGAEGDFNAVQLVSVPEPASLSLLGLLALPFLHRRRQA